MNEDIDGLAYLRLRAQRAYDDYLRCLSDYKDAGGGDCIALGESQLSTFADKVRAGERANRLPFARMKDGELALAQCEDAIAEILGTEVWLSFDSYDSSFEIFPSGSVEDFAPTEEQHTAILALGCSRYWINFPDGSERYMRGERRKTGNNRWESHNNFREVKRSVEEHIRAEEREACAKICDDVERQQEIDNGAANTGGAAACAASIRDRKE